mgnify:CR=1 FL=1
MKYIVIEIQAGESVSTITTQHDTRNEAESKFHQILFSAAVSSVPVHSAVLMTDEGFPLRNECYKHTVEPEEE